MIDAAGAFFKHLADTLAENPAMAKIYANYIYRAEEYGSGQENMRDFGSILYNKTHSFFAETGVLDEAMEALADAVVYITRGPGRSEARGLSFCYPADFDNDELDIYARNFPLDAYLAYMDAVTDWSAPDWVYSGGMKRLPEIDTIEELKITIEKKRTSNGMPAVDLFNTDRNVNEIFYRLYRLDEESGDVLLMGKTDCGTERTGDGGFLWRASDPLHWPAVDDTLCCINLVQKSGMYRLYNIPIQINTDYAVLRCGRKITQPDEDEQRLSDYEIYGLWKGYEENSRLLNRSVQPLSSVAGQEYKLLYPKDEASGTAGPDYAPSEKKRMLRALDVKEITLPAGTYYLEYEITDMFMRSARLDRIEFYWDGNIITFPEGFAWEGQIQPAWERK